MNLSESALWLGSLQLVGAGVLGLALVVDRLALRPTACAATRRGVWALAITLTATLPLARLALPAPALALPNILALVGVVVWSCGALLLALRWLHGIVRARQLIRASTPITEGPWLDSLAELDSPTGPIEVRLASGIGGPLLAGVWRPIILIPAELTEPTASERRAILTHELAHLARADNLLLHLGVWVRAIFWITPLSWMSLRRLREAAELAADDAVLESGETPTRYAAQLVASARAQLTSGRIAAGQLRARVEAILDGDRRRAPIDRRAPSLAVARLIGAAALLASLATACEARSDELSASTVAEPTAAGRE